MWKKLSTAAGIIFLLAVSSFAQQDNDDIVIGKYRIIHSDIMNEDRMLYVHLPANYNNSTESYPVLFQMYGHFMDLFFWPACRSANVMGEMGTAPEMIVVGVKSNQFRYRDLLPVDTRYGKSEIKRFLRFFEEELIPWIEKNYRTQPFRLLAGPQAAGAFGLYVLANKPDLFNGMFLSNPFWNEPSVETLKKVFSEGLAKNTYKNRFLMITLKKGKSERAEKDLADLAQMLKKTDESIRYVENRIEPDADFNMPVDVQKGMRIMFADYKFPGKKKPAGLDEIAAYYRDLSNRYGYTVKIPEFTLVYEGDKFHEAKEYDRAITIFQRLLELYPQSVMARIRLGDVYNSAGKYELSLKYYNEFLKYYPGSPRVTSIIESIKKKMKQ